MNASASGKSVAAGWMVNIPLLLCYVAFPLSNQLAEARGTHLPYRNWIDIAWIMMLLALIVQRPTSRRALLLSVSRAIAITVCGTGIFLALYGAASGQSLLLTAAMEVKPLIYFLMVVLIVGRVAAPSPLDFCRYGAFLSGLLIAEALLRSAVSGTVERPIGSGEVNYDAALLCMSLVFAMADRALARRYGWLIWAGIIASLSRTSLLAACLVLLFSSVISLRLRMLMCALTVGAVLTSFAIRGLDVGNLDSLDRYWMWVAGLDYLTAHPLDSALHTVPGRMIDVDVPRFIVELWINQQDKLNLGGIYPFHFHAMWLRLAISWGWLPVLIGAAIFFRRYVNDPRRAPEARSFFVVCAVLGLTMGLLYLGNVAPVVLLAGYRVFLRRRPRLNYHLASSSTQCAVASPAVLSNAGVPPATRGYP